ncbi:hypothetical protein [Klebsiella aerogenes]|uniref:hypothetical protein n=1 Tax=Klebsiella aerogenes TaxID=548 RepID=UPI002E329751|nr:hypothetical protein [Klebsiella aerogenes]
MGLYTKFLGVVAPQRALKRIAAREQIRAYEAAKPSRTHAAKRERHSANTAVFAAGASLREQARWLDENHDLITCFRFIVPDWLVLFTN